MEKLAAVHLQQVTLKVSKYVGLHLVNYLKFLVSEGPRLFEPLLIFALDHVCPELKLTEVCSLASVMWYAQRVADVKSIHFS